ncbi:DUF4190 domain-containing protein [Streptomyces sp. NBC_00102]|uniref:DUF4190 domain-containing protein n=1 Tax=Streptomyces sp. NBC_00102 TaxID=2975652 RepID=UPI002252495B|nr:DUF4190 domain-containing protein [Streptomyces sp. NBC_00102]MCX5400086.1 DUF4190 domain-containing protein [Streptomyces sp. NBC_00102]
MPENTEPSRDPWAAPDRGVDLGKQGGDVRPPVHDQPTITSGPGFEQTGPGFEETVPGFEQTRPGPWAAPAAQGFGPPPAQGGYGPGPSEMPPPPVSPNGPGQPPMGQYGYPAAPQPPQYPVYAGYDMYGGQGAWAPVPSNGMGVTALVLGIVSIPLFFLYGIVSIVLGVLALIFGILGRKRAQRGEASNGGMALAGIITGSVGILVGAVVIGFIVWALTTLGDEIDEDDGSYDDPFATSLVIDRG